MPVYGLIERQFIDHEARLGDYYDAREDRFCEGSILKDYFNLSSAKLTNVAFEDIQFGVDPQVNSKLNMFGINPEQKLSLKAGLLESTKFITDTRNLARAVNGTIVLRKRAIESKFNVFDEGMEAYISEDSLRTTEATHYVSGIVFGLNVTVNFECREVAPSKRDGVKKWLNSNLQGVVKELKGKPYQQSGSSKEMDKPCEMTIHVEGLAVPPEKLGTFDEVVSFLRSVRNNSTACGPVSYDLSPVENVLTHLRIENGRDRSFQELSSNVDQAGGLEILLDELAVVALEVQILEDAVKSAASACLAQSQIANILLYSERFSEAEREFFNIVRQAIISIRCKITPSDKIDEIMDTFNNCEYSPKRVQRFLDENGFLKNKIFWYEPLQKEGALYFCCHDEFMEAVAKENEAYALCFEDFPTAWMSEGWEEKNVEFQHYLVNSQPSTAVFVVEAIEYVDTGEIQHYREGELVGDDGFEKIVLPSCLVRYNSQCETGRRPKKRGFLTISCPGFVAGECSSEIHRWHCEKCTWIVEYGYDGYLYCQCGRSLAAYTSFKCGDDAKHAGEYVSFPSDYNLPQMLYNLKPREEIVILILGETGVGKSTFINSFTNYITYGSLQEAEKSELIGLIPASFVVTDDEYEETKVAFGPKDDNEVDDLGMSRTQSSRAYVFSHGDKLIKLIDTPGLGDNRGIEQDRKNSQSILAAISQYPVINGICILLKPNNAILSVIFSFCIKELLCHLHKDASQNIVFVFTNSRSTFYKPGDTLPPLRDTLKSIRSREPFVDIPLNRKTIFCVDNEAFRFLVALKNGIIFSESDKQNFAASWMKSATEYGRLIDRIMEMKPHRVSDTVSLNEARRLILSLSKPLGDITQHIQQNCVILEKQKAKIEEAGEDIEKLEDALLIPKVETHPVFFDQPRTVCASKRCSREVRHGDIGITQYVTVCHNPCYLDDISVDTVNHSQLRACAIFDKNTGNCFQCKCSWENHMHRKYELKLEITDQVDSSVKREIRRKVKTKEQINQHVLDIEARKGKFEKEQDTITKISAKFAYFLKHNAITPYNDSLNCYLEHLIEAQEEKSDNEPQKRLLLKELQKMKKAYEEEILVLESTMSTGTEGTSVFLTPEIIQISLEELYRLELSGPIIKELIDGSKQQSDDYTRKFREEEYRLQSSRDLQS